jgi:hypothetical protein
MLIDLWKRKTFSSLSSPHLSHVAQYQPTQHSFTPGPTPFSLDLGRPKRMILSAHRTSSPSRRAPVNSRRQWPHRRWPRHRCAPLKQAHLPTALTERVRSQMEHDRGHGGPVTIRTVARQRLRCYGAVEIGRRCPSQPGAHHEHYYMRSWCVEAAEVWRCHHGWRWWHEHGAEHAFWGLWRGRVAAVKPMSTTALRRSWWAKQWG